MTWRERVRKHRGLLILLVTGLLVQIFINLLSSWLETLLGPAPGRILQFLVGLAVIMLALWIVFKLLDRGSPVEIVPREEKAPRYPGLIALVGPGREGHDPMKQAAGTALEHHLSDGGPGEPLRVAWLITGWGERGGVNVAERFRERYQGRCTIHVCSVAEPYNDLQETYALVRRIYQEEVPKADLRPDQVVADLTGGTGMMTAGMALACRDRWPMEYVTGGGQEGRVSAPVLVRWQPVSQRAPVQSPPPESRGKEGG